MFPPLQFMYNVWYHQHSSLVRIFCFCFLTQLSSVFSLNVFLLYTETILFLAVLPFFIIPWVNHLLFLSLFSCCFWVSLLLLHFNLPLWIAMVLYVYLHICNYNLVDNLFATEKSGFHYRSFNSSCKSVCLCICVCVLLINLTNQFNFCVFFCSISIAIKR